MPNRSRSVVARKMARALGVRRFRGRWNLRELLDDCESCAWELEQTAPAHVTPGSIAWMAVRRVAIGRQHKQSVRSILTSRFDRRAKRPENLRQIHIHLHDLAAVGAAPSETVPTWMDFKTWVRKLDARKRRLATLLALGNTTQEMAKEFNVSQGRISQMRREFEDSWKAFQSNN